MASGATLGSAMTRHKARKWTPKRNELISQAGSIYRGYWRWICVC